MESFIFENAQYAHWLVFGLLMLAGLNFPISEDVLIVFSGVLASTVVPENTWKLFAAIFFGAYLSDWIVYWIGRSLAPKLCKLRWFARMFREERIDKVRSYYEKYGTRTLLLGRFVPFGFRNALFATAGIGKMHFGRFLIVDGIACLLSNSALFALTYFCGKNYSYLFKSVNIALFAGFVIALICYLCYKKRKNVERI
ncbi:MAG: Inner membrane protein [Chlamydiales bacterium]|nr:Inner membrane protein [Chlamydiales bacterium]MCH9619714.1 Inner membrane protein [Chlamydiales bacterium]MCH9623320.1 Inner membrane protein [Chlamydiales bacterium]